MGKRSKAFEILPSIWFLGLIVVVLGGAVLFFSAAWTSVTESRDIYVVYTVDESGIEHGFVALDVEGTKTSGFRNPQYPTALIQIKTTKRVFAPQRRGRQVSIATLSQSSSVKLRISNGIEGKANGQYWDFPSIEEQLAKHDSGQSLRGLSSIEKSDDEEFNERLRRILIGIPDQGEPILEPRRGELIQMTLDALKDGGYQQAADAIQNQRDTYSGVVWKGWLQLGGFAAFVVTLTWLISLIPNTSKKT
ncbi:MAG: hypothetical protein RLN78_11995 [Phycisphaerales bacterium]